MFNEQSSISFCTVDREFEEHIRGKIERETPPDQVRVTESLLVVAVYVSFS